MQFNIKSEPPQASVIMCDDESNSDTDRKSEISFVNIDGPDLIYSDSDRDEIDNPSPQELAAKLIVKKIKLEPKTVLDENPTPSANKSKTTRSSREQKQFECFDCKKQFSRSNNLKRHVPLHSTGRPFKRTPAEPHKDIPCFECGRFFTRVSNLKRHQMLLHLGELPYGCEFCGLRYKSLDKLRKHVFTCYLTKKEDETEPIGETSSGLVPLTESLEKTILMSAKLTFSCIVCNEQFKTTKEMNKHRKTHTEIKPFICDQCGWKFRKRSQLRDHIRIHTGILNFIRQKGKRQQSKSSINHIFFYF